MLFTFRQPTVSDLPPRRVLPSPCLFIDIVHVCVLQEAACRALRALTMFSVENQCKVAEKCVMLDVFAVLNRFPHDPVITEHVLCFLGNLATAHLDHVLKIAKVPKGVNRVYMAFDHHSDSAAVQAAGCYLLYALTNYFRYTRLEHVVGCSR